MKKRFLPLILIAVLLVSITPCHGFSKSPRVAIVITASGMETLWERTQQAAHSWTGVMHLAGIPYDTLFLDDVLSPGPSAVRAKYSALVLAQCRSLTDSQFTALFDFLNTYLSQNGNLIIDGILATRDPDGQRRDPSKINDLLGIKYLGFQDG
jgi:hypothetical protein